MSSPTRSPGILSPAYVATTIGTFSLIVFVAFESMAVVTVMPDVAKELDGVALYALSFAAPLASGVIGMVAAGMWSDRQGPVLPLIVSMVMFSVGLLICGLAPAMEILVVGRVIQGLGGGALTVGLYVVVGKVFPARLQPSVFASFAAAWVLPALFGPAFAAWIAHAFGWRWVFLGAVVMVAMAGALIAPALRQLRQETVGQRAPLNRLAWATVGGVAVLAFELIGSRDDALAILAAGALVAVGISFGRLTPPGTLRAGRGLPAVIATRGLLSASFFCAETYIVFVLQDNWGLSAGHAGLALTGVGITWAASSQIQARLGDRVSHIRAMRTGMAIVLIGTSLLALTVWLHGPAWTAIAAYVFAGAGMGFGYPRLSVAMLAESTDADRGFNSSALSIADSLGAALALSISGVVFASAERWGGDRFVAVFVLAVVLAALGVAAARRTAPAPANSTV